MQRLHFSFQNMTTRKPAKMYQTRLFIDLFNNKYQHFQYSLQELSYREFESACEQSKRCEHLTRIVRVRCVRECISPSCYQEIYELDEVNVMELIERVRLNITILFEHLLAFFLNFSLKKVK